MKCIFNILTVYSEYGELIEFQVLNMDESSYISNIKSLMEQTIQKIMDNSNPNHIIVHRDGQYFKDKDQEIMNHLLSKLNLKVNLHFIEIQKSIIRIYDLEDFSRNQPNRYRRIDEGLTVETLNNHYAMVTFPIKNKNSKFLEEDHEDDLENDLRTSQTISIQLHSNEDLKNEIKEMILQNIFNLTQAYHGYTKLKIKNPITIHSAKRIFDMYSKQLNSLELGYHILSDRELFV
jgi:hypothetical protein